MSDLEIPLRESGSGKIETGTASESMIPAIYRELRQIAGRMMADERPGHTLQATALVHEAYLRLAQTDGCVPPWKSRGHFFSAAAEAMRRILIEVARKKSARKRGSGAYHTPWDDSKIEVGTPAAELLEIDEALGKLEAEDTDLANLVKLRYFAGMTVPETAAALGISTRSVNRKWECARAWLYREISRSR